MRRLRRIDPRIFDWVLALGLGIGGSIEVASKADMQGPLLLNVLATSSVAIAVLVRRRRPLLGLSIWMGVALFMAAFLTQPSEMSSLFLGLMIFPWAVGAHTEGRRSYFGLALAVLTIVVVALDSDEFIWGDIFFPAVFGAMLWLAGRVVRSRSRLTAELHEATVRLHEQREAEAHAAVAEERRRIAREMHDVVAHSVSTMVIQAGGARRILARDPARAVEAAALIERTGREALGEMRHLLGVLHAGENLAALTPQPTLLELGALAERSRAAGLPVELHIEGERRELPPGVDLAAYRVIQEALTNSLKHGGGSADGQRPLRRRRPAPRGHGCGQRIRDLGAGQRPGLARDARARPRVRRRAGGRAAPERRLRGPRPHTAAERGGGGAQRRRRPERAGGLCMSVRIMIADDQALVRAGFKMILDAEDDIEVVGEANDGLQAVDMARRLKPDVVLMDIRMPELDGIEATRRVVAAREEESPTRVIMLTTFDLNEYVYEALRAGASGFLLKDVPPEQLAEGIRIVAGGEALLAPSITRRLIEEFAEVAPAIPEAPPGLDELTARELEVFKLIARGLSNAEIAAELIVSETTVKTHVARMLMKLGLRDRVQAVVLAYESGVAIPGRGT